MENTGTKKILLGLGWTTLSTIVSGLTQILRLSILARFLVKEDFGVVAILTFILGLTQVFSDLGFSAAIMSERELSKSKFLSLYWLQFMVFNVLMVLVSMLSPLIAYGYGTESLIYLVPLMLSELFFFSIGKLYDTVLQKNMQFKTMAIRNIFSAIFSLILAVFLAYLGMGVFSLVLSTISQAAIVNVWNLISGQKTYKLQFAKINIKEASELIKVGLYQMGTQLLDYVSSKLDILVIGGFLGNEALGVYNLAKELVLKFVMVINTISTKVMLSVFSASSNDMSVLASKFKSFLNKLSYLNTPIVGFVFLFSSWIVRLFYGAGYEDAIPIVGIMAIWSLFVVLGQPNGLIAIVTKRTDITFAYTIIRIVIMGVLLFAFARTSLVAASTTMLIGYIVMMFVNWGMLIKKTIKVSLFEYIFIFFKSWIGVLSSVALVLTVRYIMPDNDSFISNLIYAILYVTTIVVYIYTFDNSFVKGILQLRK